MHGCAWPLIESGIETHEVLSGDERPCYAGSFERKSQIGFAVTHDTFVAIVICLIK